MACATAPIRRRSSVTNTAADVDQTIDEAFLALGMTAGGTLGACEVERVLKHLLTLKDPHNDADSICAAIDINEDGHLDPNEFHRYIHPTVMRYAAAGKPLDVQDILRDAFRATIESDTATRNKIIQAFMQATSDFEAASRKKSWALPVNKGWMHKLYSDAFDEPKDAKAPRYKHSRTGYLTKRLTELQVIPRNPKSEEARAKEDFCKSIGCPNQEDLVAFCGGWLARLALEGVGGVSGTKSDCSAG
uniref:EF-hand domain-containing protein n=1 Tax=Hemiselmis tepida TaxID=464990 RepID=A0A7S0YZ69_9CRYP|mmetsp:Transcript_31974/g.81385  ORF Transcript_31974/g.81385 Transcript_31974/m.81385 type:complete len:247 (+) Transcript_31974:441-1181(+)|eukprot:CAMPEP_0174917584 /NCGR_PEP_ID=MMETSP1355-20121228/2542_1 /TAXON_ID=464990 /ORGANISM="Hemiselmis tepida, Strain CCMP443" /LENGTH=246 /DNA_ID=CAMNT_0016162691 /DNA_START=422 /DNA_END=1162 /DNA_ORIENTATION=+